MMGRIREIAEISGVLPDMAPVTKTRKFPFPDGCFEHAPKCKGCEDAKRYREDHCTTLAKAYPMLHEVISEGVDHFLEAAYDLCARGKEEFDEESDCEKAWLIIKALTEE